MEDVNIKLRLMKKTDLKAVIEIRNDPDTYKYLHTPKIFSLQESEKWYDANKPIWYVIEQNNKMVGYIRTSEWDYVNKSIWIGCDIHKDYRRKGIAYSAYLKMLEMMKKSHWNTVKLSVLKTNPNAFHLYKKLGFEIYEETNDSYNMQLVINNTTNTKRGVKVIACYFGNRRFDPRNENPQNASDALTMLQFIWKIEQNVDQGYPHDTCFVHNELLPTDPRSSTEEVNKCVELLNSFNNKSTKNGKAFVITRPNIGLSFGAFDHAFNQYNNEYDYWFFTEDDQIIVKKDTFKNAIAQLHLPKQTNPNGFVATVGVNREWGPGASGGCGVTSREILNKVTEKNFSHYLNRGSLPFHYVQHLKDGEIQTNNNHEWSGEVMFTKIIHDMGYYLEECNVDEINMSWKDTRFGGRRTPRCTPYESWMDDYTIQNEILIEKIKANIVCFHNNTEDIDISSYITNLTGLWVQDNGDTITYNHPYITFNNKLNGTISVNSNIVKIKWDNTVQYTITLKHVLDNNDQIEVTDNNGNKFNINRIITK